MHVVFHKRFCSVLLKGIVKKVAGPAFLVFIAFLHFSVSLSAAGFPSLGRLGIEQGLSNNSVKAIYQDHLGFLWFLIYEGLNRYEGYELKIYKNRLNDSTLLPHNYIYAIAQDLQNNLWVSTGQGICIYNYLTAKFLPAFYRPYSSQQNEKTSVNATVMKTTRNGTVLMGTNGRTWPAIH